MESFVRKEQKYLLTQKEYEEFMETFRNDLVEDPYSPYEIRSIYFDNRRNDLMNRNFKKPAFRQKIRLRSYGPVQDSDSVFLEMKKKLKGTTFKKRITIPYQEARKYLKTNKEKKEEVSNTGKELVRIFEKEDLEPSFYVRYHRKAYVWKDNPDFRLTFDTNLISQEDTNDLNIDQGSPLLKDNVVLMELKAPYALPLSVSRFLSQHGLFPANFSKAATSFKRKEGIA